MKISKVREKINFVIAIVVGGCVLTGAITNNRQLMRDIIPTLLAENDSSITDKLNVAENTYQTNFAYKKSYADIYGVAQKVLNRKLIGNFEFICDGDGIINAIREYVYNTDQFVDDMSKLKTVADENNTPLLYVQGPNRELVETKYPAEYSYNVDNGTMTELVSRLSSSGIEVLDERELLLQEKSEEELENLFLHTDLHLTTESELWAANKIGNYMYETMGIPLNNLEYLSELDQYFDKTTYQMIGNYGRNVGKFYTDLDQFSIYKPKFDTNYIMYDWSTGEQRAGAFDQVLMNGFENSNYDEYTYWVVNYLMFQKPYYTICNLNQDTGKILVITDSIGYRTISQLSLTASEITVLDPRFFNGTDYIEQAFSDRDYDAVVVYQGTFLTDSSFCIN